MNEDDIQKTAIITPFSMLEFLRLPFGLRNTGNTFQRMMDQILGDLPFCFVCVDDILIFSPKEDTHVQNPHRVFELLHLHGLHISLPKCIFAVSELEFLRHNLSSSGCSPLDKHTFAISSFPMPSDKPAPQRFLGMLNFYRKFIKNTALILAPLTNPLKDPGKLLDWTPPLDAAFRHARDILSTMPILVHPIPGAPVSLAVDVSNTHGGGVLLQSAQQYWSSLGFFSRKLSVTKTCFSAFDFELLAAFFASRHFFFSLEGRDFILFTDHKPLTHALFRTTPTLVCTPTSVSSRATSSTCWVWKTALQMH